MNRTTMLGLVGMVLALAAAATACTRSADRMSGAALPQEAPPAAVEVGAAVPASDTLGVAPDASDDASAARPAGLPVAGSPSACQTLLKPIDDALKAGGSLILAITIVPANGAYVSYAEGEVKRVPKPVAAGSPAKTALEGTMWQQFSDRVAPDDGLITKCAGPCPTPNGPALSPGPQRFVKDRLDKLGVSMDVATGTTSLTLYSWNNAVVRLTPTCENGMFYGYGDGKLYAMTGRLTRPIPTRAPPRILP